jgi:hypothetical protein
MGNKSNRRQRRSKKTRNTSRDQKSKQTPEASNTERQQIRDMTTSSAPESNQGARDEPAESTANDPASQKQSPQQQIGSSMSVPFQLRDNPSQQQETRPEGNDLVSPLQYALHSAPQNLPRPPIDSLEFDRRLFSRARGTSLLSSLPILTALIKTEYIQMQQRRLEMETLLENRKRNDERLTNDPEFQAELSRHFEARMSLYPKPPHAPQSQR